MFLKNMLYLVLVFGVVGSFCHTQKVPCALDDSKCTTPATDVLLRAVVLGYPDKGVPSSDPLHQDVINAYLKDFNYTLTDAYLYGMKDCRVKNHSLNLQQSTWNLVMQCPQLILKSNYETSGVIGGNYVEGKGQCQIVFDKYHIGMSGGFDTITDPNGNPHFRITGFDFDLLEVLENVKYEFSNLYYGDAAKSEFMHKYINENWKSVTSFTKYPTMHAFMSKLLEHVNIFLLDAPPDQLFFKNI